MAKGNFTATKKDIKNLSASKKELALKLVEKAVFMDQEMRKLQDSLSEKGWVEEYQNGANQKGLKKSSEGEVYIALSRNYTSIMKQINDILPASSGASADELMSFLKE